MRSTILGSTRGSTLLVWSTYVWDWKPSGWQKMVITALCFFCPSLRIDASVQNFIISWTVVATAAAATLQPQQQQPMPSEREPTEERKEGSKHPLEVLEPHHVDYGVPPRFFAAMENSQPSDGCALRTLHPLGTIPPQKLIITKRLGWLGLLSLKRRILLPRISLLRTLLPRFLGWQNTLYLHYGKIIFERLLY